MDFIKNELNKLNYQTYQQLDKKFQERQIDIYHGGTVNLGSNLYKTLYNFQNFLNHISDNVIENTIGHPTAEDYAYYENALTYLMVTYVMPKLVQIGNNLPTEQHQRFMSSFNKEFIVLDVDKIDKIQASNDDIAKNELAKMLMTMNHWQHNLNLEDLSYLTTKHQLAAKYFVVLKEDNGGLYVPYLDISDIKYLIAELNIYSKELNTK